MGAWDTGLFDNDNALDWVLELEAADDNDFLTRTLEAIPVEDTTCVESPEAECGLAAGEVVAALLGRPAAGLPDEVKRWLGAHRDVDPGLAAEARRAVRRILDQSELRDCWQDSEWHFDARKSNIKSLLARLSEST